MCLAMVPLVNLQHLAFQGFSVVRMLEGVLGRAALLRGLATYLAAHQFGNTVARDLFESLEVEARRAGRWPQPGVTSLAASMELWTSQVGTAPSSPLHRPASPS